MVVNEKGLLKAMKEAYKLDGYTVAVDEADLILKTVPWTVVLHMMRMQCQATGKR